MALISESLADIQYVTTPRGDRTNVIVPLEAWESLLTLLEELAERLEDQEDVTLLQAWLQARQAGTLEMIPLHDLEAA